MNTFPAEPEHFLLIHLAELPVRQALLGAGDTALSETNGILALRLRELNKKHSLWC